jgi:hypothetical protein
MEIKLVTLFSIFYDKCSLEMFMQAYEVGRWQLCLDKEGDYVEK